jgi:7-cyano-7-deazaguanine synthase
MEPVFDHALRREGLARRDAGAMAIVLLSGGLDSCVAAAWAVRNAKDARPLKAVHFSYGQTHEKEFMAGHKVADALGIPYESHVLNFTHIKPGEVGHLLKRKEDFNPDDAHQTVRDSQGFQVSATFVPGRNIIFLAYAGSLADSEGHRDIVCGVNSVDFSGYPDCRPRFIERMEGALSAGLRNPVRVHAPLINLSKVGIVRRGMQLNAPLHLTWSCYAGGATPCDKCPSCEIRNAAFKEIGIDDPARVGNTSSGRV